MLRTTRPVRSPWLLAVALVTLTACGGTQPTIVTAMLASVNGASYPVLLPGEPLEISGSGFGSKREGAAVIVSAEKGWVSCDASSWSDEHVTCRLPDSARSGSVTIVLGADTLAPLPLLVRDSAHFDTGTTLWQASTALPAPRGGAAVAAVTFPGTTTNALAIVYGGVADSNAFATSALVGLGGPDGSIGKWSTLADTAPPLPRLFAAAAGADRSTAALVDIDAAIYVLGGVDSTGRGLSDVVYLTIGASGSHNPWSPAVALPEALDGVAAVVARGHLFVAGGVGTDGAASDAVYMATINGDGSLTGWFAGPSLPIPVAFASLVARGTRLYLLGGESGQLDLSGPTADSTALSAGVFSIPLSPRTGYFAASTWQPASAGLVHARAGHAAFAFDDGILVDGGAYVGAPSADEAEFAPFIGDSLGEFAPLGTPTLSDIGGVPLALTAGVMMADGNGLGHPTLVGGITLDALTSALVWMH